MFLWNYKLLELPVTVDVVDDHLGVFQGLQIVPQICHPNGSLVGGMSIVFRGAPEQLLVSGERYKFKYWIMVVYIEQFGEQFGGTQLAQHNWKRIIKLCIFFLSLRSVEVTFPT